MIIGILHRGSGLGDQLFSYIATRVRAADLGVDFGFVGKEFFKGSSFMNLDWGKEANLKYFVEHGSNAVRLYGTNIKEFKLDKPYYDPEFNFIPDGSVIDGYGAQDIRYFEHRLDEVREWLKTQEVILPDDIGVFNFRGGEYKAVPELYLPKSYWEVAHKYMFDKYHIYKWQFHTDDIKAVKEYYPSADPIRDIATNWMSIRYAKYLIISNSAFAILPALLNENVKEVIAPKFWAGRNVGEWRRPNNYYKKFLYI